MNNRVLLFFIGYFVLSSICVAQQVSLQEEQYNEKLLESISGNNEVSLDLSSLLSDISEFKKTPLNINSASQQELEKLIFLNDFQILLILEYRNKVGKIQSIFELGYLPGFNEDILKKMLQYLVCGEPIGNGQDTINFLKLKPLQQQLLLRWQRIIEKQEGYTKINDSILAANPNKNRYLGSPHKIFARYHISAGEVIEAGLVLEKDAGEEFFKGSNPKGFDFNSGYLSFTLPHNRITTKVIFGDYHLRFGQGLLCWSSYNPVILSETNTINRRSSALKGNQSADENRFFRGVAFSITRQNITTTGFFSSKKLDANLQDSAQFTSFIETGYHATPNDIENEKSVQQTSGGVSVQYNKNPLHLSIQTIYSQFDKNKLPGNTLYNQLDFAGNQLFGFSADYRYLAGKVQLFGETAFSHEHFATINGLLFFLNQNITVTTLYRNYNKAYYSFYSNAIGQNSTNKNEQGFLFQSNLKFSGYRLVGYADVFKFPFPKYQTSAPTEGYEFSIEAGKIFNNSDVYLRFRQSKVANEFETNNLFDSIIHSHRNNIRLNFTSHPSQNLNLQSRIELTQNNQKLQPMYPGIMVFQDIKLITTTPKFEFNLRLAWFSATDYDNRLYAYEKDVLYAYSSTQYYGKGWRGMVLVKWNPGKHITFWLKYGSNIYNGETETGSDLTTIKANHKSEIKIQCIVRLSQY